MVIRHKTARLMNKNCVKSPGNTDLFRMVFRGL